MSTQKERILVWKGKVLDPVKNANEISRFKKYAELEGITFEKALERDTLPPCDYWKNPCNQDWCKCMN